MSKGNNITEQAKTLAENYKELFRHGKGGDDNVHVFEYINSKNDKVGLIYGNYDYVSSCFPKFEGVVRDADNLYLFKSRDKNSPHFSAKTFIHNQHNLDILKKIFTNLSKGLENCEDSIDMVIYVVDDLVVKPEGIRGNYTSYIEKIFTEYGEPSTFLIEFVKKEGDTVTSIDQNSNLARGSDDKSKKIMDILGIISAKKIRITFNWKRRNETKRSLSVRPASVKPRNKSPIVKRENLDGRECKMENGIICGLKTEKSLGEYIVETKCKLCGCMGHKATSCVCSFCGTRGVHAPKDCHYIDARFRISEITGERERCLCDSDTIGICDFCKSHSKPYFILSSKTNGKSTDVYVSDLVVPQKGSMIGLDYISNIVDVHMTPEFKNMKNKSGCLSKEFRMSISIARENAKTRFREEKGKSRFKATFGPRGVTFGDNEFGFS